MRYLITLLVILVITIGAVIGWSHYRQQETMPLVPMMRLLLSDMQTVNRGIYTENYKLIAEGAGNVADHPKMTETDKKIIKETLGEEMKKFVAYDMTVHQHADSMRMAARAAQMHEVLRHYAIVQQGCVSCHNHYRKPISEARSGK